MRAAHESEVFQWVAAIRSWLQVVVVVIVVAEIITLLILFLEHVAEDFVERRVLPAELRLVAVFGVLGGGCLRDLGLAAE